MTHSTTIETLELIHACFLAGIVAAELSLSKEAVLKACDADKNEHPLGVMAFYDGYIRRKYGLVDENGEEIFR